MANSAAVAVDRVQTSSHNARVALKNRLKADNSQSLKKMSMSTNISVNYIPYLPLSKLIYFL